MKQSSQIPRGRGLSRSVFVFWLLLLVLPAGAGWRLAAHLDPVVLAAVAAALSLVTYLAYRSDKRRAEAGARRLPESALHLAELLGGWPGAFLAQHRFRHKVAKLSYQLPFWSIVLLHQALAADVLSGGRLAQEAGRLLRGLLA